MTDAVKTTDEKISELETQLAELEAIREAEMMIEPIITLRDALNDALQLEPLESVKAANNAIKTAEKSLVASSGSKSRRTSKIKIEKIKSTIPSILQGNMSKSQIAEALGKHSTTKEININPQTLSNILTELAKENKIKKTGERNNTVYFM